MSNDAPDVPALLLRVRRGSYFTVVVRGTSDVTVATRAARAHGVLLGCDVVEEYGPAPAGELCATYEVAA